MRVVPREPKDLVLVGLLAVGAFAVRWQLAEASPYGDEAVHYAMARTLGFLDRTIVWEGTGAQFNLLPFVLGRPLFAFAHFPGALVGFTGFRVLGIVYASLLAPVAYMVLRQASVDRWIAAAAGTAIMSHPTFVVWGARIFPDSLMAVLALLAVAAWVSRRPVPGSILVTLACWTKESALAVALGLAGLALFEAAKASRREGRPLVRGVLSDRAARWACAALVAGAIPVVVGYMAFPRLPGWAMGGDWAAAWERLWLSSWLAIAPVAALNLGRARPIGAAGTGIIAFYALFGGVRGGFIQSWYAVLPATVALMAVAALLDAAFKSTAWPRLVGPAAGCLVAGLLLAGIAGTGGPVAALHPLAPTREPGLVESIEFVRAEGPEVKEAWEFQRSMRPAEVLLVDVYWFWVAFPFAGEERTQISYPLLTLGREVPVERIAATAESSDLVWMQDWNGTFEKAFRETYADCEVFTAGNWVAVRATDCPGRGTRLRAEFERLLAA
jgi:hypothetical protein